VSPTQVPAANRVVSATLPSWTYVAAVPPQADAAAIRNAIIEGTYRQPAGIRPLAPVQAARRSSATLFSGGKMMPERMREGKLGWH
jgi:hypothetical protein